MDDDNNFLQRRYHYAMDLFLLFAQGISLFLSSWSHGVSVWFQRFDSTCAMKLLAVKMNDLLRRTFFFLYFTRNTYTRHPMVVISMITAKLRSYRPVTIRHSTQRKPTPKN